MKIVVDDKIPYIRETLAKLTDEVVYLKGSEIGPEDVRDADALIVRTRTLCNEQLLKGSKVQFVATATIGYDHLDTTWLEQNGITWTNCPGCNSGSVAQYIESALLTLIDNGKLIIDNGQRTKDNGQWTKGNYPLPIINSPLTLAVVGCGHVGSKVCRVGERLGMRVLVNDPPLEASLNPSERRDLPTDSILPLPSERVGVRLFVPLETIAREADIITFHVPLDDSTRYLADEAFFNSLQRQPVIINSSRGGVVDEQALLRALDTGKVSCAVIDTWEHEPDISRVLLNKVYIGTPHIAGYSADGKVNADNMVIEALCRHFHLPLPPRILPPPSSLPPSPLAIYQKVGYNVMEDSQKLKNHPEMFEELRGNYPVRREIFDR